MLQLQDVTISYHNTPLLSHFTMHVRQGEMAALVGESGSGKTSILRAIMGFVPTEQGSICVGNTPLKAATATAIRKQIAYVPQELSFPTEWVAEMIQVPFALRNHAKTPFSEQQLHQNLAQLGVEADVLQKRLSEISVGQKQRIMIAVAAMLNKPLLLLDEPTSALDGESAERVAMFLEEQAVLGKTILAVTHDERFASVCSPTFALTR